MVVLQNKLLTMRKLLFFGSMLAGLVLNTQAQVGQKLPGVLAQYYALKNSLVAGDAVKTGNEGAALVKVIQAADTKLLTAAEQKTFQSVQVKLLADATAIAASKEIGKQRDLFSSLSASMITLAKATRLSDAPVYVDYCPMKKSYWLSEQQAIKNPYYGNSMLTCGNVKETIKQ